MGLTRISQWFFESLFAAVFRSHAIALSTPLTFFFLQVAHSCNLIHPTYLHHPQSNVDDEARSAAKAAALGSIRDPVTLFYEQRIIMSLPPVAALKKSDPDVYELLEIFQQGKLEDFQSFLQANPTALSNNNISEDNAIRHMRLLSLCSLATEHEEIPYDAIATTLQVDQSVVENWVIDAVASGLLSAKMDQLQHVVMVERCVVRRFGIEQWKILQERLSVWKKNVKGVLDGLKQSQI